MHFGSRSCQEVLEDLEVAALDARCAVCRQGAEALECMDLVKVLIIAINKFVIAFRLRLRESGYPSVSVCPWPVGSLAR